MHFAGSAFVVLAKNIEEVWSLLKKDQYWNANVVSSMGTFESRMDREP